MCVSVWETKAYRDRDRKIEEKRDRRDQSPFPPYLQVLHSRIQPATEDGKYSEKKIPESSKKQNLNLMCAGNYLHSMYIVLGIID